MRTILIACLCLLASASADAQTEAQRGLIDGQIARFANEAPAPGRVYFLGFAGYGEERVFAEEIKLAARVVGEKYHTSVSVLLINDRRDRSSWPMASASSLR